MGYSRKNRNRGVEDIFSEKTPGIFRFVTLPRGGFRVQKKVVTNFCKIDTTYIKVIALIFVIVVVIIIIANVAILFLL